MSEEPIDGSSPHDILGSLPAELQNGILNNVREACGIQGLFPARRVNRKWRESIDNYLYAWFLRGPESLWCYVSLWNRFRQRLIQQRVCLRLRIRMIGYQPPNDTTQTDTPQVAEGFTENLTAGQIFPTDVLSESAAEMVDWQPSSDSSDNASLSPRNYSMYIYDACFDGKLDGEKDKVRPIDIRKRTPGQLCLGTGLTRLLVDAGQPPRSGTIFPLFHVVQEAWDFIMGGDPALRPIYPPIASEAWLQIRLATGPDAYDYPRPPPIRIEQSRDPFWPFQLTSYNVFGPSLPGYGTGLAGQHQFAVISRLALPNLVEDEGILLVTIRDTDVGEWIEDARYRDIMRSMIDLADTGGPQEFVVGGAVVRLEDYERFIPKGMIRWFRRRILGKSLGTEFSPTPTPTEYESEDSERESSASHHDENQNRDAHAPEAGSATPAENEAPAGTHPQSAPEIYDPTSIFSDEFAYHRLLVGHVMRNHDRSDF
jgi:hypothetical protein